MWLKEQALREAEEVRFAPQIPSAALKLLAMIVDSSIESVHLPTALRDDEFHRKGSGAARLDVTATRAARLLLADLLQQGWTSRVVAGELMLRPPSTGPGDGEKPEEFKRRQRETLQRITARQLNEPSVRGFLRRMESPRSFMGRRVSVLDLVDDGRSLAAALAEVAQLPPSEREAALERVVKPVIEVATADTEQCCPHTGLVRLDIWRYFRHTWSLEYRPTPGRTIFFLIRNVARPMAPVMGIASLANANLQLKIRDNWIGWTVPVIVDRL